MPRLTSPVFGSFWNAEPDFHRAWLPNQDWLSQPFAERLRSLAIPAAEIWDLKTKPIDLAIEFSHSDNGLEMARLVTMAGCRKIGYANALRR